MFSPRIQTRNTMIQTSCLPNEITEPEPVSLPLPQEPMPYLPLTHNEDGHLMEESAPAQTSMI